MSNKKTFNLTDRDQVQADRHGRRARNGDACGQIDRHSTGQTPTRTDARQIQESNAGLMPLWIKFAARALGATLDGRLARGEAPESSRLLAARAQLLVSPTVRQALAQSWLDLLIQPHEPVTRRDLRVPVIHNRVEVAEAQIRAMLAGLLAPLPTARGVAMSSELLSDGAGPLYNPHCSVDLGSTLRQISQELDPFVSLPSRTNRSGHEGTR
jgi:hypothetical protein